MTHAKCGATNAHLVSYETARKGNPFETTVFAWSAGEAKCERPEHSKRSPDMHRFNHGKVTIEFDNTKPDVVVLYS